MEVNMDINKIIPSRIDNLSQSVQTSVKIRPDQSNTEKGKTYDDVKLTKENVNDLVDVLNSAARSVNERVSFSFHEKANRVIMKIVNTKTDEVVREIPPKEMIKLLEEMHELIGMFVDESR
jgi:flagellar protein FlaG